MAQKPSIPVGFLWSRGAWCTAGHRFIPGARHEKLL